MQFATCSKYIRASREVYTLWEEEACVPVHLETGSKSAALPNPLAGSLIRDGGTTRVPLRSRVQAIRLGGKYALSLQDTSLASITYLC